jgi:four helix bundle protein
MIESFCSELRALHKFDLSRQLFRAGSSIGANIWEVQEAESKADFVH